MTNFDVILLLSSLLVCLQDLPATVFISIRRASGRKPENKKVPTSTNVLIDTL